MSFFYQHPLLWTFWWYSPSVTYKSSHHFKYAKGQLSSAGHLQSSLVPWKIFPTSFHTVHGEPYVMRAMMTTLKNGYVLLIMYTCSKAKKIQSFNKLLNFKLLMVKEETQCLEVQPWQPPFHMNIWHYILTVVFLNEQSLSYSTGNCYPS